MKRRPSRLELTERQQMFLALLLVLMVAVSFLYCLGLASMALGRSWQEGTPPWGESPLPEGGSDVRPHLAPAARVAGLFWPRPALAAGRRLGSGLTEEPLAVRMRQRCFAALSREEGKAWNLFLC